MLDLTPILAAVLPIVLPPLIGTVVVFAKKEEAKLPTNLQPIIEQLGNPGSELCGAVPVWPAWQHQVRPAASPGWLMP